MVIEKEIQARNFSSLDSLCLLTAIYISELQALETLEDLVFAREEIPRLKDLPTEKRRER